MTILLDFFLLIILYFSKFYKKWHSKGKKELFFKTTLYIYLSFVLYFTLMPILFKIPHLIYHHYPYKINFVPFIDVSRTQGDFVRQILLNILMTIPFGFLLPLVMKKRATLFKIIIATALLSISIELLQPLTGARISDITDVITNTIGGILGYLLYLTLKPFILKIIKYIEKKNE